MSSGAGPTLEPRASERWQLFAGSQGTSPFADESDTAVLVSLEPRAQARVFGER